MPKKPRKRLFAGLSIDLPTGPEMYAENFHRERAADSARAMLKTPPTPPNRRRMPGDRSPYEPPQADLRLLTTRGRNGVRESVGTPSVPNRTRKSAGETLPPGKADGKRRSRSLVGYPTRDKRSEKVVYSGRVGMSARRVANPVAAKTNAALSGLVGELRAEVRAIESVKTLKRKLADAIGLERDAISRGDTVAAESARADIRKCRKSLKSREG